MNPGPKAAESVFYFKTATGASAGSSNNNAFRINSIKSRRDEMQNDTR